MKKLLLVLATFACTATFAFGPGGFSGGFELNADEIRIADACTPTIPDQMRSFSMESYTQAWTSPATQSIEFQFKASLGVVEITITNANGQVVSRTNANTDASPYFTLPMPAKGAYSLTISGTEYLGQGEFFID